MASLPVSSIGLDPRCDTIRPIVVPTRYRATSRAQKVSGMIMMRRRDECSRLQRLLDGGIPKGY
jgi:hypothetical protein